NPFEDADIVFSYTDREAVEDGILQPFIVNERDTRHRITANAYHELNEHHRPAYPKYDEAAFMRFYLAELLPLLPAAFESDRHGRYLTTDFDFRVVDYRGERDAQLWYLPNEVGG